MPILTAAWHVIDPVLTVIGALSVSCTALMFWLMFRAGRRRDEAHRAAGRARFDAELEAMLPDAAGEAL